MIRVDEMSVEIQSNDAPLIGRVRGFAAGIPSAHVNVRIYADGEDLERFMAFMREAKQGRTAAPSLPETTKALPQGPIDAEFVDP